MDTLRHMKHLTLVPIGGLANRLFAISSAIAFCKANGYYLKIYWFKDWGMGANFHDLFQKIELPNVELIDAKWYHYVYDRPRKRNLWLPWIWQRFAFGNRIYEKETSKLAHGKAEIDKLLKNSSNYLVEWYTFYEGGKLSSWINPISQIQNKVKEFTTLYSSYTVGIHIRRSDHIESINNSPTQLFIDKMKEEINIHPEVRFFVASDSIEVKSELKNVFQNRIVTFAKEVTRGTKNGIFEAVVELLLLSETIKIYGSFNSTFSELAANFTSIPLHILQKK